MRMKPKKNKYRQTNHWACKRIGNTSYKTLGDKYHALPTSVSTPPPTKNKNKNHKNHTK